MLRPPPTGAPRGTRLRGRRPLRCGDGAFATVSLDHPVYPSPFYRWVYVPFQTRETAIDLQVTSRPDPH